jgi:hypothetical protein
VHRHSPDLPAGEDDGKLHGLLGPYDVLKLVEILLQDFTVEE